MRQIPFFNTITAIINKKLQNDRKIIILERNIYFLSPRVLGFTQ